MYSCLSREAKLHRTALAAQIHLILQRRTMGVTSPGVDPKRHLVN